MGRKRKMEMDTFLSESSSHSANSHLNIIQRSAANDRERTRMRVLSKAFVKLKTSLPWVPSDTKLSKLDTLKLATSYISYLTKILEDDDLATSDVLNKPPPYMNTATTESNETNTNLNECSVNYPDVNSFSKSHNGFCWPFNSNNASNGRSLSDTNGSSNTSSATLFNNDKDNEYKLFMINQNT